MSLSDDVLKLIDEIHVAGLEPARWPDMLAIIGRRLNAAGGVMYAYRPGEVPWNFSTQFGFDPHWLATYNTEFEARENPVESSREFTRTPVGDAVTDYQCVPRDQFLRSRFYNEWVAPQKILGSVSLKVAESDRVISGMSWVSSARRVDFAREEIALLRTLAPHIMRSVETGRRIGALEGRLRLAEALLDTAAEPVVLVGADARLLHANAGAHRILSHADGLIIRRGIVACIDQHATTRLHACVRLAARGRPPRAEMMAVQRKAERRPYSILVTPMPAAVAAEAPKQAAVAIHIGNPDATIADPTDALRISYDLTAAEALLVNLLVRENLRLGDAADRLGVTLATAKSQLHHAFVKTGARGQSELVRLVLIGLPNMRPPETEAQTDDR